MSFTYIFCSWAAFWIPFFLLNPVFPSAPELHPDAKSRVDRNVARNALCSLLSSLIFSPYIPVLTSFSFLPFPLATLTRVLASFLIAELWFYHIHRLFHSRRLFRFHEDHHKYILVYPLSGMQSSLLELLLVNQPTAAWGPLLFDMPMWESMLWFLGFSIYTLWIHSAWDLTGGHGLHHHVMKCNFGLFGIFDRLYGTYRPETKSAGERSRVRGAKSEGEKKYEVPTETSIGSHRVGLRTRRPDWAAALDPLV